MSPTRLRFAGVVPAAGASRRMGRPKATLTLDGHTFLERVVTALDRGGCDPVLVVVTEDDEVAASEAEAAGARVLRNGDPGEGPITSLRLALSALDPDADGIAFLPLDHALVTGNDVARLIGEAERSKASLVLPVHGAKRGHPALFRRELFAELADPELDGGARTVVHRHLAEACLVPFDDEAVIEDVDTPADYERVRAAREPGALDG